MSSDTQATLIKFFAVVTAMPRWVAALLAAEGLAVPQTWLVWWLPASALFSAGMAIVEGMAFAYVFSAWRRVPADKQKQADRLFALTILSAVIFIAVLAPYVAASVRHVPLADILSNGYALGAWACAVAASTICIVASVGYAQKPQDTKGKTQTKAEPTQVAPLIVEPAPLVLADAAHVCGVCGKGYEKQQSLAAHQKIHALPAVAEQRNGHNG